MANPRAFLSFDFDNNEKQKMYFTGQAANSITPFYIEDWSSKTTLPQNQWEQKIDAKINKCHLFIVLVGKKMSTATGVAKEISFARKNKVPIFGVYVDGADEKATLPEGLPRNRVIEWNWNKIENVIKQLMKEGKNK